MDDVSAGKQPDDSGQLPQESRPAESPKKKIGKRDVARIIGLLLMIISLALLFLPLIKNEYYVPSEESAQAEGAGDASARKEPDEQEVRERLQRGIWMSDTDENLWTLQEEAFPTDELLALYDLPFTTEEYISFLKKAYTYNQKERMSLVASYLRQRNGDRLRTLRYPASRHYLVDFSYPGSEVPDSTYLRMVTVSEATSEYLRAILYLILAFCGGALLFLFTFRRDTESRRKFFLVAIPVCALLLIGMRTAYNKAQTFKRIKMIREGGVSYLLFNDTLRVAGIWNDAEIGEELVIPDTVQGYPVVSVLSFSGPYHGHGTISSKREAPVLERIVLPDSVRVLWTDALTRYNGSAPRTKRIEFGNGLAWIATDSRSRYRLEQQLLTDGASLFLPASVRYISAGAFYNSSLEEVIIAKEAPLSVLPTDCFAGCARLRTLQLPDALVTIEDSALSGCKSLGEIRFPDTLQTIGYNAFWECTSLQSIVLPGTLEKILPSAFRSCTGLVSVEGLDFDRISVGTDAFYRTPFSENPENFGGPYPVITADGTLTNVYGAGETVDVPETVKSIEIYRLPTYVRTVVIPENNVLSTISYQRQITRNYRHPLTLKFQGDGQETLLAAEEYHGLYGYDLDKAGLLPKRFLIVEAPADSAIAAYARDAGIPYRITGADDTLSEDGYRVGYRFRRRFAAQENYDQNSGYFHVELIREERPETAEEGAGSHRYRLAVVFELEGSEVPVGSFVIDDLPADDCDMVPLSTIGFSFDQYEGAFGSWFLSVYCGTKEIEPERPDGETVTKNLFRRYRLERSGGSDGIGAAPGTGGFTDDGYYLTTQDAFPHYLDEIDRYLPDGE